MAPGLLHNKGILPRLPMTEGAAAHGGRFGEGSKDGEMTGGDAGVTIAATERAAPLTPALVGARVEDPRHSTAQATRRPGLPQGLLCRTRQRRGHETGRRR
ncbi:unnamed protein product [Sphacelaria rigidula]